MMNGDYTKVPLRRDERWTGARMQEGRVLLDHEWNLNLDAAARAAQSAAADVIGPAGVPAGSDAFRVDFSLGSLTIHEGRMWVDGLAPFAPAPFTYASQDQIDALPATGTALVYLDVFEEHVQPAEDPLELLDPALAHVDSAARTRVGYRVRVHPTTKTTCKDAFDELTLPVESTGTMTITRTGPPAPADPCSPPGDPLGRLPDGLFRVEVLDAGAETAARFVWSYEDGSATVAVAQIAADKVTLAPSPSVAFATGDLVEVSWLARRADRKDHGALYVVGTVATGPGGDELTLDRAVTAPPNALGLTVRRWDGQAVGAAAAVDAALRGADLGVRFTAGAGAYQAGDWWGARLREEEGDGVEHRTNAPPDGIGHAFAPLALVDLGASNVLHDCRPTFTPLVDLEFDTGSCTVSVKPGDDLQAAVDSLPAGGGEVCFAAGIYPLQAPVVVSKRTRVVFNGAGPATVLRALHSEAAVVFDTSTEVEVRHMRFEGGSRGAPPGDPHLNGAVTFTGCTDVVVADCVATCPDSTGKAQACITVRSSDQGVRPDRIRIDRNRLEVGAWQTGVLVVDADSVAVADNHALLPAGTGGRIAVRDLIAREAQRLITGAIRMAPGPPPQPQVVPGSPGAALAGDFLRLAGPSVARLGLARGSKAFAARVAAEGVAGLSQGSLDLLGQLGSSTRAALAGIVVGGARVETVQILDNVVEGAVQGIHIGVSDPRQAGREGAGDVVVSGNIVHSLVPPFYDRERHAVFVGNARSVRVLGTSATLARPGRAPAAVSTVEGIRIYGTVGPFLVVRDTSLTGFTVGVRVEPLATIPRVRLWLVAETMAQGAATGKALVAPATVDRERNIP
jgi:hypothetical protein